MNNFQEKTIKQQQTTGAKSNLKSAIHAMLCYTQIMN